MEASKYFLPDLILKRDFASNVIQMVITNNLNYLKEG
jgi:hypothetical protein